MIDPRTHALLSAAVLSSLLLSACGGGSTPEPAPVVSSFTATPASVLLGASSTLAWSVSGATSVALDQGIGVVTGTSQVVNPGMTTTYTLTATGPGGTTTRTATVTVTAPPTVLEVACSGASCGASSPTLYSGTGVGIWRFRNTSASARTVDLHVGGVTAGKEALLVFSNGTSLPATLPSPGALASPPASAPDLAALRLDGNSDLDRAEEARQAWHGALLEENRRLGLMLRIAAATREALAAPVLPVPVEGDHRTWIESVDAPIPYDTVAREVCDLPGGRKAVLWVDPNSTASGSLTTEDLAYFRTTFCGPAGAVADGGFGRVTALMGDVWGTWSLPGRECPHLRLPGPPGRERRLPGGAGADGRQDLGRVLLGQEQLPQVRRRPVRLLERGAGVLHRRHAGARLRQRAAATSGPPCCTS